MSRECCGLVRGPRLSHAHTRKRGTGRSRHRRYLRAACNAASRAPGIVVGATRLSVGELWQASGRLACISFNGAEAARPGDLPVAEQQRIHHLLSCLNADRSDSSHGLPAHRRTEILHFVGATQAVGVFHPRKPARFRSPRDGARRFGRTRPRSPVLCWALLFGPGSIPDLLARPVTDEQVEGVVGSLMPASGDVA